MDPLIVKGFTGTKPNELTGFRYFTVANTGETVLLPSNYTYFGAAYEPLPLPNSLEAIAGAPDGIIMTPGGVLEIPSSGAYEARTLYGAAFIVDNVASYPGVASLGNLLASGGRIMLQASSPGGASMSSRVDTINGSSNLNATGGSTGVRVPGAVVIGMVQVNDGLTLTRGFWGSASLNQRTLTPGDGIPNNTLQLYSENASMRPICALGYMAEHDEATARRIVEWLTNQYRPDKNG